MATEAEQYQNWVSDHTRRILEDPEHRYNVYDVNAEQIWMFGEGVPLHDIQAHGAVMIEVLFKSQELALEPPMETEI